MCRANHGKPGLIREVSVMALTDKQRPAPPADLLDSVDKRFVPAPAITEWMMATFIEEGAPLRNPDHEHLAFAEIGALWTNVDNARAGRQIVGQCEIGTPRAMGRWAKARAEQQVIEWFGSVPDFILTFHAGYAAHVDDATFCALVEHELYHAAQDVDVFGMPKFRQDGSPAFVIRGHDVEEFIGVVRRYGADASGVKAMVDAANAPPEVAKADIAHACGTCHLRVA